MWTMYTYKDWLIDRMICWFHLCPKGVYVYIYINIYKICVVKPKLTFVYVLFEWNMWSVENKTIFCLIILSVILQSINIKSMSHLINRYFFSSLIFHFSLTIFRPVFSALRQNRWNYLACWHCLSFTFDDEW